MNEASLLISGVAIGSGWQAVVAYVNLTTYYVIGLPIGCVLGFKTDLGAAVSPNSLSLSELDYMLHVYVNIHALRFLVLL